jgi:hypothetical protein
MALKKRTPSQIKRTSRTRESYDKVLIVCEGKKTEPYYLEALRNHFKLSQANVVIDPDSQSAPISVVDFAIQLSKEAIKSGDPYTRVYCVIDKDRHPSYTKALDKAGRYAHALTTLKTIVSIPCFEYWILMHYESTTMVFGASGRSPCDNLINSRLQTHIPGYSKANKAKSKELVETRLEQAIVNSKSTLQSAISAGTDDPSTRMHELVEYLKNLKS